MNFMNRFKIKSMRRWAMPLVCMGGLSLTAGGDPEPQPQMDFAPGSQGTFNADWDGVAGRTYFMEFSMDLVNWYYAPFMHFGDGEHQRGIASNTDKFFLRLRYEDVSGINNLEEAMAADFDADGLANIFELMNGLNPYLVDSNGDGIPDGAQDFDEDGMLTTTEQATGRDPEVKDNPAVKLSVVVGN